MGAKLKSNSALILTIEINRSGLLDSQISILLVLNLGSHEKISEILTFLVLSMVSTLF